MTVARLIAGDGAGRGPNVADVEPASTVTEAGMVEQRVIAGQRDYAATFVEAALGKG